ncbi:MAG: S8 family serine peptidase [Bacteroidia bacterium]|nr:S8 family serine peptidase [Bacteroidia bacterium]
MRPAFLRLLIFCCLLGLVQRTALLGQVEVNLRLAPGAGDLADLLRRSGGSTLLRAETDPLLATYGFLSQTLRARALLQAPQAANDASGLDRVFTLTLSGSDPQAAIQDLLASGWVEFAEENRKLRVDALTRTALTPNDDSLAAQWYLSYVRAPQAWDRSTGSPAVRIGIIDTGLDYGHPEFQGQLHINAAEDANGNGRFEPWPASELRNGLSGDLDGTDADQNGFADDVIGYDFTDQPRSPFGGDYLAEDPDPLDDNAHGTVVTGVIAARMDNQYGGAGLAPGCRITVLRAFAADGSGEDDDVARAIVYAADNGIPILNLSFGDIFPSILMHEAIRYAYRKGVVMVCSAGNGTGDELHYPSGFDEVISVSASTADFANRREYLWPLSSYGLTVDLCAPGAGIFTTTLRDTLPDGSVAAFTRANGTSLAAPMVTAAAGLLFSATGPRTPQQTRGILTSSADDISAPGWDHLTGAGRVNLERMLQTVGNPRVEISAPANDGGSPRDTVWITGSVAEPELVHFSLDYQAGTEDTGPWQPIVENQPYQVLDDTLGRWVLTGLPEGEYTLRLRVERSDGFTSEERIRFVRDKSAPLLSISRSVPVWDNQVRKWMVLFRASDQAVHTLYYRQPGEPQYRSLVYDRITRNGDFLLGPDQLGAGEWEAYIESRNRAGLAGQSALMQFSYEPAYIPQNGFRRLPHRLPMGRLLDRSFDFDGDGLREAVMSEYDAQLSFGRLKFYEFNGQQFVAADSVAARRVLIPKDVRDSDGDGLMELFASVNDSAYIYEQAGAGLFPKAEVYKNEGNKLYAAQWAQADADPDLELVFKDERDYFVFDRAGGSWQQRARLADITPDYTGSVAPRIAEGDFDGDGKREIAFGDFDGDFVIYEYNGSTYEAIFADTTALTKSGNFLTAGDFDGDGRQELFVAVHSSALRNADFEYDTPHLWLRVFKSTGDNRFEAVWEDFLYDLDTDPYNAATAGNLDADPADELVFTTFPRTYLLDYSGGAYGLRWFQYGALATHHIIADFDGNGIQELGLGRGDSTLFYERDVLYAGPQPVQWLDGVVLGPDAVRLSWPAAPGATGYEIWRVPDPEFNTQAVVIGPVGETQWTDTGLEAGKPYLYVLRSANPALSPPLSGFGAAIVLRPHARPRIDSARAAGPRQAEVWFSYPAAGRPEDRDRILLNGQHRPAALIGGGSRKLLLAFLDPFAPGEQVLRFDSTFTDADLAPLDPASREVRFTYEPEAGEALYLTRWRVLTDKSAELTFNYPLDEAGALDTAHYRLAPVGGIDSVTWASDARDAVQVHIRQARFGALGYPLSVTVTDLCSINDLCLGTEGNTATFSAHKADLSEVFAYPNPVRSNEVVQGMRFANLTRQATVEVFTVSGRRVTTLEERDGDGGLEWNLLDEGGRRIKPGIYVYRVSVEDGAVEEFVGKFTVVD